MPCHAGKQGKVDESVECCQRLQRGEEESTQASQGSDDVQLQRVNHRLMPRVRAECACCRVFMRSPEEILLIPTFPFEGNDLRDPSSLPTAF